MVISRHLLLLPVFCILCAIPPATPSLAQDFGDIGGVSDAEACADLLKGYLKGEMEISPPCDESQYEFIFQPYEHCSTTIKQKAQKAHAICVAIKATPQDIDNCNQTANVKLALVGCTRIINDQTQSVTDRVFAHVQAGNAYVLNPSFPYYADGISHYDKALKLDPRSVLALAARAIANWRDADQERESLNKTGEKYSRQHALADYRQAVALDAAQMSEMTAGNADLKKISAAAKK